MNPTHTEQPEEVQEGAVTSPACAFEPTVSPLSTDPLRIFAGRSRAQEPNCTDPLCVAEDCEVTFQFFPYKGELTVEQLSTLEEIKRVAPADATFRFQRWGKMHACRHNQGCKEPGVIAVEVIAKHGETRYARLIDL